MKKYAFFVCTLLFLALQCISLNHQYGSEHFFVHDNTCAQCQFMQQTENAQIPDIIELCEIGLPIFGNSVSQFISGLYGIF